MEQIKFSYNYSFFNFFGLILMIFLNLFICLFLLFMLLRLNCINRLNFRHDWLSMDWFMVQMDCLLFSMWRLLNNMLFGLCVDGSFCSVLVSLILGLVDDWNFIYGFIALHLLLRIWLFVGRKDLLFNAISLRRWSLNLTLL